MKLKTILLSIFLLSIVAVNAQKFITTKGKDIIGIDGKPFLMKDENRKEAETKVKQWLEKIKLTKE